jgi:hypothetical protein
MPQTTHHLHQLDRVPMGATTMLPMSHMIVTIIMMLTAVTTLHTFRRPRHIHPTISHQAMCPLPCNEVSDHSSRTASEYLHSVPFHCVQQYFSFCIYSLTGSRQVSSSSSSSNVDPVLAEIDAKINSLQFQLDDPSLPAVCLENVF